MSKIELTNGKAVEGRTGQSIFQAARNSGILFDHSCLTGRCGSCRGKITKGKTQQLLPEEGLTETEKQEGYILTCSRAPLTDILIDMEDLTDLPPLEAPKTVPCKVSRFEYLSEDVIELELRFPPGAKIKFLPGQYVNLIKGKVRRSYSIAGEQEGKLLFYIKNYPGGAFSQYLFHEIKVNDLLRLHGPLGTFCYRSNPVKNSIFMATGTGIAPIKAMLDQLDRQPETIAGKQLYLFFGGRHATELFFKPDYRNLSLHFFPCLSREGKEGFHKGYIQNILTEQNLDFSDSEVYACGSENMINTAQKMLLQRGLQRNLFYADAFLISS